MTVFLLVHGAMHGGWCWHKLAQHLQKEGHDVFTPTLTGMGERSHLLTRETGLYTHVDDLLGVLKFEGLSDVIVVGHSYAGLVVTQLAETAFERIQHLVYLAAFVAQNGQSLFDKLDLKKHASDRLPKTYIHCTQEPMASALEPFAKNAKANGWGYSEIDSGHDVMVTEPKKLAELLLRCSK